MKQHVMNRIYRQNIWKILTKYNARGFQHDRFPRIVLLPIRSQDAISMLQCAMRSKMQLIRYYRWPVSFSERDSIRWARERETAWLHPGKGLRTPLSFGIHDDGQFSGVVELGHFDPLERSAEISYFVDSPQTGKGLARQTIFTVVEFLFVHTSIARVYFHIATENPASEAVARHLGATQVAVRTSIMGPGAGWEKVFKLTRANLSPADRLSAPLDGIKRPCLGSCILEPGITGLKGYLHLCHDHDGFPGFHYTFDADSEQSLCMAVDARDEHSAEANNRDTQISLSPSDWHEIRAWVSLNKGLLLSYHQRGDLMRDEEVRGKVIRRSHV